MNTAELAIYSEDLPPLLAEICAEIGWRETLDLVEAYGGVDLFVPATFHVDMTINQVLREEAAKKLIAKYGGSKIYIARLSKALRNIRNKQIAKRLETEPAARLAREYQLSERTIWYIAKCPHTLREMQPDLFGG
jgi:hypothetical protein